MTSFNYIYQQKMIPNRPSPSKVVPSREQQDFQQGIMKSITISVTGILQHQVVDAMNQQLSLRNQLKIPQWNSIQRENLLEKEIRVVYYTFQNDHLWEQMKKILEKNDIWWQESQSGPPEEGTKTYEDLLQLIKEYHDRIYKKQQIRNSTTIKKINETLWINITTIILIILKKLYNQGFTWEAKELLFQKLKDFFHLILNSVKKSKCYKMIGQKSGYYLNGIVESAEDLTKLIIEAQRLGVQQSFSDIFLKQNSFCLGRIYAFGDIAQIFQFFYQRIQDQNLKGNKYSFKQYQSQEDIFKQLENRHYYYDLSPRKRQKMEELIFRTLFLSDKSSSNLQKAKRIIQRVYYDINPQDQIALISKKDLQNSYWIWQTGNMGLLFNKVLKQKSTQLIKISPNTILEDVFKSLKNVQDPNSLKALLIQLTFGFAGIQKSQVQRKQINENVFKNIIYSCIKQLEQINQSTLFKVVTKNLCQEQIKIKHGLYNSTDSFQLFFMTPEQKLHQTIKQAKDLLERNTNCLIIITHEILRDVYLLKEGEEFNQRLRFEYFQDIILRILQNYEQFSERQPDFLPISESQYSIGYESPKINKSIEQFYLQNQPKDKWIAAIALTIDR